MLTLNQSLRSIRKSALALEPEMTVSRWADRFRELASQDSAEPGRWQTGRTPYLREIMDALSPSSPIERVVVMAGAQLGKTSAGLNWLGYIVHQAPGPVLAVQPTLDMCKRFSRQRLDPLFEQSPALRGLVKAPRARDSGNTMLSKEFMGGVLILTGANSPTGLRSMPVRYLFLDEVDAFPADADHEGDPVDLAMRRTETFTRRKVLMTSTPSMVGFSRIERAFDETDQRRYFVPCLHCGDMATITWSRIRWPQGAPEAAECVCEACGGVHTDRDKDALLRAGEWRTTQSGGDPKSAGFHLSGLYSPWRRWGDIAVEHVKVARDPARLQVFVNTRLAECWEDQAGEAVHPEPLMARREDWGESVPAGVCVLTAGVDVQDDRLELQVIGWGVDEESWVIDHRVLWGDPASLRLWAELEQLLLRSYECSGTEALLRIEAAAIDTGGHYTKAAYDFCRPRLPKRIWGIKGAGGPGIPVWPKRASRVDGKAGKLTLFRVGVDSAKDMLFARLKLTAPGPGYIHFSKKADIEYFRQLTGEKIVTRYVRGRPVRSWQPRTPDQALEALDTFVYAMAALHGLMAAGLRVNERVISRREKKPSTQPQIQHGGWFGQDIRENWI